MFSVETYKEFSNIFKPEGGYGTGSFKKRIEEIKTSDLKKYLLLLKNGLNYIPRGLLADYIFFNGINKKLEEKIKIPSFFFTYPEKVYFLLPHFIFKQKAREHYINLGGCNFCLSSEKKDLVLFPVFEHLIIYLEEIDEEQLIFSEEEEETGIIVKYTMNGVMPVCVNCMKNLFIELAFGDPVLTPNETFARISHYYKHLLVMNKIAFNSDVLEKTLEGMIMSKVCESNILNILSVWIDFGNFIDFIDFERINYMNYIFETAKKNFKSSYIQV